MGKQCRNKHRCRGDEKYKLVENNNQFTEEEEKLADFSKQILAGTEDVWTEQFQLHGMRYQYPTLVLFTGAVQTACGNGSAAMGPFLLLS